jgi:hypothetical protein
LNFKNFLKQLALHSQIRNKTVSFNYTEKNLEVAHNIDTTHWKNLISMATSKCKHNKQTPTINKQYN